MDRNYTYDELVKQINELTAELQSVKKYGLVWDKENTVEDVVKQCESNIPTIKNIKEKTLLFGKNNNLLIEGDNYHSLINLNYILQESVDVIYIDPPYNTGHEDFTYNDKFVNEDDGFRHSKWLNMLHKRLVLSRNLLKRDGIIFVSIDDNEQANLKLLLDSVFGDRNFLVNMVVTSAPAGTQSSTDFAQQHSYCLAYRKTSDFSSKFIKLSKEEIDDKYSYGSDERGKYYIERLWKRGIGGRMEDVPSLHFPVWFNEKTKQILIDKEIEGKNVDDFVKIIPYQTAGVLGRWTWSREKMYAERDYLIVVKVAGEWKLHKKVYESQDIGKKPYSIIDSKLGRTELGSLEIKNIMGDKVFDYPKYSKFIKYLISLHPNKNAIVLDYFAGSGTTGQATAELNIDDGGNRKFILCTNNENNICEKVTYERLKTVISGKRPDGSKYSDGIKTNLYYFKDDFIPDLKNSDQAKYNLVEKVDSLLCIKEDAFECVSINDCSSHYKNGNKHLFIYNDFFNENKFNTFKNDILKTDGEKIVYVYSNDNNVDENIFDDESITVKPIPSKIYEIYKEIAESIKRGE